MTYFLEDAPVKPMPARGPDQMPSSFLEGIGAATSAYMLDRNVLAARQSAVTSETSDTVSQVYDRIGEAEILRNLKAKGLVPDMMTALPHDAIRYNHEASDAVLQMGRDAAAANPDAWTGTDLSPEGIQKRANEALQAERNADEETLSMLPKGRGAAEFIGSVFGTIADPRQLPLLLAGGGGGSVLKVMAREAMLNVSAEAVTLPSQYEMAKVLDRPDPDVARNLLTAAAGGAVIGGGMHGLGRALEYFKGRSKAPRLGMFDEEHSNIIIGSAEDAIVRGENPIAAASRAVDQLPVPALKFDMPEVDAAWAEKVAARASNEGGIDRVGDVLQGGEKAATRAPDAPEAAPAVQNPDAAHVAAPDLTTSGPFGPIFHDVPKTPEAAIERLMKEKTGEVMAVVDRPDLGPISLVYGNEKHGLRHIEAKHPEMMDRLPSLLRDGELAPDAEGLPRAYLVNRGNPNDVAVVRLDWYGKEKSWVVTAFPDVQEQVARHLRTSNEPDASVPSRIPDTTGQPKDTPQPSGFQGSQALSDPASPEARPVLDAMTADIRDEIAKGDDFKIDMGDGRGERLASSVLDDLDKGDAAAARFDLCGRGPT